jgi:putative transposase
MADVADRGLYRACLLDAARAANVAVHAYSLLPTEVRLLVSPHTERGLADLMQAVGRRYVRAFNQKYQLTGTPWEGRFRSAVIEVEAQFLPCLRFVETGTAGDPPVPTLVGTEPNHASSLAHHLGLRGDTLVTDHPAFWDLGNTPFDREAAYRRFIDQPVDATEVAAILHAALNGWVLGSQAFADMISDSTGRRPQRIARGRPRKSPERH